MTQKNSSESPVSRAIEGMENVKRVGELVGWTIGAASAAVAFVNSHGGPIYILVQIALFGFACYLSAFIVVPLALFFLGLLESSTNRETNDGWAIAILSVALLAGGSFVRFVLFYPGIGEPGDFDGFGTGFAALCGVGILLIPLVLLWWRKGSRPAGASPR